MILSEERKYTLVKSLALLSLVRWYNVLLVTFALYLSSIFMINSVNEWKITLLDFRLHVNITSLALFIMAGYIINAFYDFEKDMVNRPETTIFNRVVSKTTCLRLYLFLLLSGFSLSSFLGLEIFIFNFLFSFGLWFYSHKLRKKILTGELGASILSIIPFVSMILLYDRITLTILLYVGYIFSITAIREVIKKLVYMKGDLIVGEKSLPIVIGIRKTKTIVFSLMLMSLIPIGILYPFILERWITVYFAIVILLSCFAIYKLHFAKTPDQFDRINAIYKWITLLGIFSIPLV